MTDLHLSGVMHVNAHVLMDLLQHDLLKESTQCYIFPSAGLYGPNGLTPVHTVIQKMSGKLVHLVNAALCSHHVEEIVA